VRNDGIHFIRASAHTEGALLRIGGDAKTRNFRGGKKMKHLCRRLTGRCPSCGQKLNSKKTTTARIVEINNKGTRLASRLGRMPQTQTCKKCNRIVFEGQPGFVQNYLLIDMGLGIRPKG
jgi:hypothetical protein